MTRVAALYVDPRGPYPLMQDVDCWDEARDARRYNGLQPVVAHPPCGPWGRLKHLYQGSEHDCALRALEQVRKCGGVLEHPAHSGLWAARKLPLPGELMTDGCGLTIQVDQVRWGHVARKRTWLYLVGVRAPITLPPDRKPTHWIGGSRFRAGISERPSDHIRAGIKACSHEQARRTPPAFAEWLVSLARSVGT